MTHEWLCCVDVPYATLSAAAQKKPAAAVAQRLASTPPGQLLSFCGAERLGNAAALGLLLRALGRGCTAALVRFFCDPCTTGEEMFALVTPSLSFYSLAEAQHGLPASPAPHARQLPMAEVWLQAASLLQDRQLRLLVLDGVDAALGEGGIDAEAMVQALRQRSPQLHVVLCAAALPPSLAALCDAACCQSLTPMGRDPSLGVDF